MGRADVTGAADTWAGYEGCRTVWAFEARLRCPTESHFREQSVTGRATWAFEAGSGCPTVDALRYFNIDYTEQKRVNLHSKLYLYTSICSPYQNLLKKLIFRNGKV